MENRVLEHALLLFFTLSLEGLPRKEEEGGAPWDDFTKPGYKDLDLGELMPPHLGMVMGC
jgi:hypothetical protein